MDTSADKSHEGLTLPPVDKGAQAWVFVFCSFVMECLVWGIPFSFGVFQEWYLTHPPFENSSEASINAIGTVCIAIQYFSGIFLLSLFKRYPAYIRPAMFAALIVCVVSLVISSFATKVWHLILLQGVIYGIAGGTMYAPCVTWLSEWFVTRRSLAGSLIFGGSGLGGAAFPVLTNYLLAQTGFRWTIRILALIIGVCAGTALLGIKPRLPIAPVQRSRLFASMDVRVMLSPLFITIILTIFVQGLGFFVVSLYIPSYAAALGFSRLQGSLALTAFNLATVFGQILFGYYCDLAPYTRVMIFSGVSSTALAFCLWAWSHSLALLFVFVVIFGSISGGFSSIWAPACAELSRSQPTTPFMLFACIKGIAAAIGPLVAASLHPTHLDISDERGHAIPQGAHGAHGWGGYGFNAIIIFVGSMMAATSAGSLISMALRRVIGVREGPKSE